MPVFHNKNYLYGVLILFLPGLPAIADNEDAIARCARIASVGDRILCLEDALRQADGGATENPDDRESEHVDSIPHVRQAATTTAAQSPPPDVISSGSQEIGKQAAAAMTAASLPDVATSTTLAVSEELGTEQLTSTDDADRDQRTRINAHIVAYDFVGSGRLRFRLDNGQIWEQTGDDDGHLRQRLNHADTLPVEMWRSRSGGYRMRITSVDRTVKVKRLK